MFTILFPHYESSLTARCFSDDDLRLQLRDTEGTLEALRQAGEESKLLVVNMFRGYDMFLFTHLWQLVREAQYRGILSVKDGPEADPYLRQHHRFMAHRIPRILTVPRWRGARWLLESHRSHLIRKDPYHYGHQFPRTPLDMPLLYPQNVPGHFEFTVAVSGADRQRMATGERVLPPQFITGNTHLTEAFA